MRPGVPPTAWKPVWTFVMRTVAGPVVARTPTAATAVATAAPAAAAISGFNTRTPLVVSSAEWTSALPGEVSHILPASAAAGADSPDGAARGAPPPGRERPVQCGRRLLVDALAVADENVLRVERCKPARREETEERVDTDAVADREEVADRPERAPANEHAPLGPPERDLAPLPPPHEWDELERRAVLPRVRDDVVDPEPIRQLRRVPRVPVEELDHARDVSEGGNRL